MFLVEDTRQKIGQHELKHECWTKMGANIIRCRLPFGDYVMMPKVAVDTKADLYEVASNIEHQHGRFRDECLGAQRAGCQLIILVENLEGIRDLDDLVRWTEPDYHFYERRGKRKFNGERLAKAMRTMSDRYGVRWEFCTPNEAAERVIDLLQGGDISERQVR